MKKQLSENMKQALELYDTTFLKPTEICEKCGVTTASFYGVLSGRTEMSPRIKQAIQIYQQGGITLTRLAEQVGVTRKVLSKYLKNDGIEVVQPLKKYHYDEDFFSIIDTEEKAYWLGFIYADGCICEGKYDMQLEIGIKDREHLVKFAHALGLSKDRVSERKSTCNGRKYLSYRITVSSTKLCRDLVQVGVTPRKSLTLTFPDWLSEELKPHFIRGYFDGDGCLNIRKGRYVRINVVGTESFLKSIQTYYLKKFNQTPTLISQKQGQKAFAFEKSGEGARQIIKDMYSNCSVALDRKYEKAIPILEGKL